MSQVALFLTPLTQRLPECIAAKIEFHSSLRRDLRSEDVGGIVCLKGRVARAGASIRPSSGGVSSDSES